MKQLAPGVWQLKGLPPNAINVYLPRGERRGASSSRSRATR
jgi:hypothetical protein